MLHSAFALGALVLVPVLLAGQAAPTTSAAPAAPDTTPKITFGGFVDGYYAFDFNRPATYDRAYTTQPARHNEFNVNLAYVEAKLDAPTYRGRFALQEYRLGQPLALWPPDHRKFDSWHEDPDRTNNDGSVDECSYAECESCRANLYVGVRFRELTPVEILDITVERPDWCRH